MSSVFSNLQAFSTQEIIHYADNGTIESVPSDVFMKIIKEYEDEIDELKEEVSSKSYDNGYDDGWAEAVEDMREYLSKM